MKRKRTEITIEVDEVIYAARHSNQLSRAWCRSCGREALMVTPEQAAAISQVTVRTVNQRVEAAIGIAKWRSTREDIAGASIPEVPDVVDGVNHGRRIAPGDLPHMDTIRHKR